jgi:capsular exopolysaccharide synthesis family protein
VRSAEQVQQLMGMPTMGFIPKLRTPKWIYGEPEVHVLAKPCSAFAESIRGLHTGLMLARANQPPKVVLITSALPKEGKTVIAVSLARLLASAGHRVVIIDGDFRRPSVHRTFKAPLKPGLMEYLCGSADLESVVHQDRQSTADVIPAGAETRRTTELLESNTMAALLSRLAETYEIVIIDSAPVLAASDVRVLARLVDKTVFLVRWADTRQKTAVAALQQLLHAGADVAGVVISVVDVKRHAQYDFGDAAYNYSHLRRYYSK